MKRSAPVLCLLVLAACFETHSDTAQVVRSSDCYTCHIADYQQTATPQHGIVASDGQPTCSTDCVLCHTTETWQNGLGGCRHPETAFPLVTRGADPSPSPHRQIDCTECHSAEIAAALGVSSADGKNTDCIACHPNTSSQMSSHVGVFYDATTPLAGQPYQYSTQDHRFCLDCHPDGLVHGHVPPNPFILPHRGATCAKCHDSSSGLGHQGGADTLCVSSGCHDGNGVDRAHCAGTAGGQRHHPTCLNGGCHPDGRKHDGPENFSCPP